MAALIPPVHLKGIRTHGNTDPKGSPNRRIAPKRRVNMQFLADTFSLIVDPCYALTHNWWLAILLFTIIIKIILMPMALWVQKNSIVMVQLMPALNRIKIRYFGDAETIGEKQTALYKEKRYHPMLSLIPLAIQVIILFGLVDVVHGITDSGTPGTEFLGLIPVEDGGLSWIMPVLAGLSAVAMGCTQNLINPLQKEQTRLEKNTTNGLSIALSFFLGMFVAAGMAFYWICSNLLSILVQIACNIIIKPAKYIDYDELNASREELEGLNAIGKKQTKWYQRDPLAKREKTDFKRFFSIAGKHIVFYSEGSGFYKYFKGAIEWLLAHSDICIHYVTNDPNDQAFALAETQPRLFPYYIGEKRAITLMMKMDADVVVTTLGDLDNFYTKRSYVRRDIEYVYMFHHMTSMDMTSTEGEYDNYDTLLCTGPHQITEMRQIENVKGVAPKNLVECGYNLLDEEIADYEARPELHVANERPIILIAPSWQEDNIMDSCIDPMLASALGRDYQIIVRPHPEYIKRYRARWDAFKTRYADVPREELVFEGDFSGFDSILQADLIVTDWSSIFCEFCFTTFKPAIFMDTPPKVRNPNYKRFGIDSTDVSLRNRLGKSIPLEDASTFGDVVTELLRTRALWEERIRDVRDGFVFNLGHGGEAAGRYLLSAVLKAQSSSNADVSANKKEAADEAR